MSFCERGEPQMYNLFRSFLKSAIGEENNRTGSRQIGVKSQAGDGNRLLIP